MFVPFLKKKQIEDHVKILHHKESIHYALHKSFKDTFEGNSPLLKIIDEHLLSICILCQTRFDTKTLRDAHHSRCLPRFITLSLWYSEPLASLTSFQTSFNKETLKKLEMDHALKAVQGIVEKCSETARVLEGDEPVPGGSNNVENVDGVLSFCARVMTAVTKDEFVQGVISSDEEETVITVEDQEDERTDKKGKRIRGLPSMAKKGKSKNLSHQQEVDETLDELFGPDEAEDPVQRLPSSSVTLRGAGGVSPSGKKSPPKSRRRRVSVENMIDDIKL